eukprot:5604513-Amphidinium_carterae.1
MHAVSVESSVPATFGVPRIGMKWARAINMLVSQVRGCAIDRLVSGLFAACINHWGGIGSAGGHCRAAPRTSMLAGTSAST